MTQRQRFTRIIRLLRKRETTAEELAELFGVSIRTIYRDISALRKAGMSIVGEPGIGYHMGRGPMIEALQLSAIEVEALVLATRRALAVADPSTAHTLVDLQRKVDAAIPAPLRDAMYGADAEIDDFIQRTLRAAR